MTLTVHTDPNEPAGGFAFFELPDGSLSGDQVKVAIFDAYGERWLAASEEPGARVGIGDPHWQSERFEFGPYSVHSHQGALWVRVGPEIVNKIEEYAPLRIDVAGTSYDVVWPDDVPPRAGAAVLGGLRTVERARNPGDTANLVGKLAPPAPEPPTEPEPEAVVEETEPGLDVESVVPSPPDTDLDDVPRRGGLLAILLILLMLGAAGAAAWFFWPEDEPLPVAETEPTPEPETAPQPEPVVVATPTPTPDQCTASALRGLEGGFVVVETALRSCGAGVAPDLALSLIEDYAAREDGDALVLFGTLYDGVEQDDQIETEIGLNFEANDARAAEYYARAVAAGSALAPARLVATCSRLQGSVSTLARGAYDDYCG